MACLVLARSTLRLFPVRTLIVWEELPAGFGAGTGNGQKLQPWAAQRRLFWSGLLQRRWQNVMHIQPKTFSTGLTFPIISQGHSILHILKIILNDFYNLKQRSDIIPLKWLFLHIQMSVWYYMDNCLHFLFHCFAAFYLIYNLFV